MSFLSQYFLLTEMQAQALNAGRKFGQKG